jgi:ABC-type transport system substrate-binding protein
MKEGAAVSDPKKRQETYRQVLQILQEKAYVYSGISVPGVNVLRKEVQGVINNFAQPDLRAAWINK